MLKLERNDELALKFWQAGLSHECKTQIRTVWVNHLKSYCNSAEFVSEPHSNQSSKLKFSKTTQQILKVKKDSDRARLTIKKYIHLKCLSSRFWKFWIIKFEYDTVQVPRQNRWKNSKSVFYKYFYIFCKYGIFKLSVGKK